MKIITNLCWHGKADLLHNIIKMLHVWRKSDMDRGIRTTDPGAGSRVFNCGGEQCAPGHTYGPAVRDHYLIHFVASGRGTLYADGRAYSIEAGQGFIIFPDEITTYGADLRQPWAYDWVGYTGEGAAELTRRAGLFPNNRVFTCPDAAEATAILRGIAGDIARLRLGELAAAGGLMRFLSRVDSGRPPEAAKAHRQHYERARWFMEGRCTQPITVEDVAAFTGLSRSQLYRVFCAETGRSPKQVLTDLRLRRACRLLEDTALSVEEVAASVGFASAQRLGVAFRAQMGIAPTEYRKRCRR